MSKCDPEHYAANREKLIVRQKVWKEAHRAQIGVI